MGRVAILLYIVVFTQWAAAFDIEPEYQGFSATELSRLERPTDLDGEYQSIVNAYMTSLQWDRHWYSSSRSLDSSVGSITNQHFSIRTRAHFETDLLETLRFRFLYFAQEDREIDQSHHVFELSQRLLPWLWIGGYGEPGHYKRENDLGFSLTIRPTDRSRTRLYYSLPDFTRGNHNDEPDRFLSADPSSVGATSIFDDESLFVRAGFRYDRSVLWNVPQQARIVGYEKKLAFVDLESAIGENDAAGARIQYDMTFKSQAPLGTSTIANESWVRERHLAKLFYKHLKDDDAIAWEVSLMQAARNWTNQFAQLVTHEHRLMAVTGRLRSVRREESFDHVQLVFEGTDFQTFGDLSLTPANQQHQAKVGRLQTAYEFALRHEGQLMFAFNFDLDEWSGLPTFEGGNAQFRIEF